MTLSEIENLRELAVQSKIYWSKHCLERMQERDISRKDVINCIEVGDIIENYPDDFPNPSYLILGVCIDNKPLHVVVGSDGSLLYIITTYYPNLIKFYEDYKTRR